MEKEELTELADDLLHIAIGKCDSLEDAQDSVKLKEIFRDDYTKMIQNPVIVPKHIRQDIPGFLRYLNTCCYFPSALIYEVRQKGLFLKGYEKPAPAVVMEIELEA